jgi:endonuclease/exonuclease/phosphatase family metal-dependent hydrolase
MVQAPENVIPVLTDSSSFDLLIWNIGYAGLDKKMDFFYDGGKQVRSTSARVNDNLKAIGDFLEQQDSVEIIMLQEADVKSKRSYRLNEVMTLSERLKDRKSFYGKNYDVFFVPLPFAEPMGSVNSGLLSLSGLKPSAVERYSFPGQYAWPKRLFMLDRCFLVMHFPVTDGKELLVINTHNEAYDDGSIRDTQMAYLKSFLESEYSKGNYIIVGGDWNQCPPDFRPEFSNEPFDSINNKGIRNDYLTSGWHWVYESKVPTNRRVDIPYTRGTTLTTVIDFYLLSPNLKADSVFAHDLQFENSDHQPVFLKVSLQKPVL